MKKQFISPSDSKRKLFAIIAACSVIFLIPWTTNLYLDLPTRVLANHWDIAWTGFDILLLISLLVTFYSAFKKLELTFIAAPITATLLIVDAWFDIVTSSNKNDLIIAILSALVAEIPLAIICIFATIASIKNLNSN